MSTSCSLQSTGRPHQTFRDKLAIGKLGNGQVFFLNRCIRSVNKYPTIWDLYMVLPQWPEQEQLQVDTQKGGVSQLKGSQLITYFPARNCIRSNPVPEPDDWSIKGISRPLTIDQMVFFSKCSIFLTPNQKWLPVTEIYLKCCVYF